MKDLEMFGSHLVICAALIRSEHSFCRSLGPERTSRCFLHDKAPLWTGAGVLHSESAVQYVQLTLKTYLLLTQTIARLFICILGNLFISSCQDQDLNNL